MANINPVGFDLSTGRFRPLTASDTLTNANGTSAGVVGATGVQGVTGIQGTQGTTGIQGNTGAGIQGATGIQGNTGVQAATGVQGTTGIRGVTGISASSGLSLRYIEGMLAQYASDTTVTVTSGQCRNNTNTADIILSSDTTVNSALGHSASDGLAQLNGLDEKGLDNLSVGAITCSQSGTTITATGDVTPHYGTHSITGTISSSSATVTGTGTKFLSEVAIGDLIGTSTTYGWSRVTDIDSNTSLTVVAAHPGGNIPGGTSATVIHNPTIKPGTSTCERVNTINAAGTAITVDTSTTIAGGSALTIGGLISHFVGEFMWLAVWVINNGSTPGTLLSTQHNTLLAPPSGYNSYRRIGWVQYGAIDDSSKTLTKYYYQESAGGARRLAYYLGGDLSNAGGSAGTVNIAAEIPFWGFAPRTSNMVKIIILTAATNSSGGAFGYIRTLARPRNIGDFRWISRTQVKDTGTDLARFSSVEIDLLLDGAGFAQTQFTGDAAATGFVIVETGGLLGFYDVL